MFSFTDSCYIVKEGDWTCLLDIESSRGGISKNGTLFVAQILFIQPLLIYLGNTLFIRGDYNTPNIYGISFWIVHL